MAKGYCTLADVSLALGGATLTDAESNAFVAWLGGVEDWIDSYCNRAWRTGPRTGERYDCTGERVYLRERPITSVEAVVARWNWGTASTTLVAGREYTVDLTRGILFFSPAAWTLSDYLLVSYTPVATVPSGIRRAAAQLLAEAIQHAASGTDGTVGRLTVWHQIDVTYRAPTPTELDTGASPAVIALLAPYRAPVLA